MWWGSRRPRGRRDGGDFGRPGTARADEVPRPTARGGDRYAPANTLGIRRVAFAVDDIDAAVAGLQARGAELVGGVERYDDSYRLCYVRGPEGIIVMLTEQLG
ncbi:VOC family protein [Specibacter cremeus]|uniref:VOC family protein n=1 Tax=Specibacter cremeus TaxID=1629051 RepID=UPI0030B844B0